MSQTKNLIKEMMDLAHKANEEQSMPNYLLEKIELISDKTELHESKEKEIEFLNEKLSIYHTYAQTGYLGGGYTPFDIEESLKEILGLDKIVDR